MTNTEPMPMVLIVDDSPTNVTILAEVLKNLYRIKVASNGMDALEIAHRELPDLILLDVMMPEMNGYEVCRQLKRSTRTRNITVIFITAKNTSDDEEEGLNLGAVDYIIKPFVIPIVKARIRNHLNIKCQADLLESLSLLDNVTHISNRLRFNESLVTEWKRTIRNKTPLSLLIIGIDHFKHYNDHYGYGTGDICLKRLAKELARNLARPGDFIARYSGNKFAVMLPDTDEKGAVHVAERLRQSVEKLAIEHAASETQAIVTVSIGLATQVKVPDYFLPKMLNDAADNALKMAKQAGRNRVFAH